jgi:hypothetical protein
MGYFIANLASFGGVLIVVYQKLKTEFGYKGMEVVLIFIKYWRVGELFGFCNRYLIYCKHRLSYYC